MYAIDFGFFPLTGIALGGVFFALYYWGLRLRCRAKVAQAFIVAAMLLTTLCTFFSPARLVEREALVEKPLSFSMDAEPTASDANTTERMAKPDAFPQVASLPAEDESGVESLLAKYFHLETIYLLGVFVVLLYFLVQLLSLLLFRRRQEWLMHDELGISIYQLNGYSLPFSFGHSIFLPSTLSDEVRRYVLLHEQRHVLHKHYLWLLGLEVLVAMGWFNPFLWLFFREMHLQQELEVDADVLSQGVDRQAYQLSLVTMALGQGKWILTRSAFLGEPLKKRLLFMNTPIDTHDARLKLLAASGIGCMALAAWFFVSCQTRQRECNPRHPFQGCWEVEWSQGYPSEEKWYPQEPHLKFCGDYGDLTLVLLSRDGANFDFSIGAMEQHLVGDTLKDVHGHNIEYEIKDDTLLNWRWRVLPGEEKGYPDGKDYLEQWHRTEPDRQGVDLLRAVTEAEQADAGSMSLNGVWRLDSITWDWDHWSGHHLYRQMRASNEQPAYLLVNAPYYMRIEYTPTIDFQTMCFTAKGDCGEISVKRNGYLQLQENIFELDAGDIDEGRIVLSIDESHNPYSGSPGVYHFCYRRDAMPDYLKRMFRPALTEE